MDIFTNLWFGFGVGSFRRGRLLNCGLELVEALGRRPQQMRSPTIRVADLLPLGKRMFGKVFDKLMKGSVSAESNVFYFRQLIQKYPPSPPRVATSGVTLATVRSFALPGVDFISIGALTHSVKVFDVLGREVATLVNGETQSAGSHHVAFSTSSLAHGASSGVYFYRLDAGHFMCVRKLMLLR